MITELFICVASIALFVAVMAIVLHFNQKGPTVRYENGQLQYKQQDEWLCYDMIAIDRADAVAKRVAEIVAKRVARQTVCKHKWEFQKKTFHKISPTFDDLMYGSGWYVRPQTQSVWPTALYEFICGKCSAEKSYQKKDLPAGALISLVALGIIPKPEKVAKKKK